MKSFILSLMIFCCLQSNAQTAHIPKNKHKFIVIAHRGEHTELPENTIASYEQALKSGVDYVEIDLRTTKDSVLVIMHDGTINRMTNGRGKVSQLTFAELQGFTVIDKIKQDGKTYPIPTFADVLNTCKDKIDIYLDFKDASVEQAYKMICDYKMEKQVIVYINKASQYTDWKRIAPKMPLMVSLPGNVKAGEELKKFLVQTPVALLDGSYAQYTPELLKAAAEAGVAAWPDIQSANEANNWDSALGIGFKGLQTDHPKELINYLVKKGLR